MAIDRPTTIVECPSEKNRPTPTGRRPFLHQFARHIVDRRDMVGVEGVAEAETIGERRRPEQHRKIMKGDDRPDPCGDIGEK